MIFGEIVYVYKGNLILASSRIVEDRFLSYFFRPWEKKIRKVNFNVNSSGRGCLPGVEGEIELVVAVAKDMHLQIWAEHNMGFAIFLKYLLFQDIVVTNSVMWES